MGDTTTKADPVVLFLRLEEDGDLGFTWEVRAYNREFAIERAKMRYKTEAGALKDGRAALIQHAAFGRLEG